MEECVIVINCSNKIRRIHFIYESLPSVQTHKNTNMNMHMVICNRFPHPCVVIDVLVDVWVEEVTNALVTVCIFKVRAGVVIDTLSAV